ncbi:MAG: methionyl-tRNA formyltransferase [Patescibacteria group bacterium]|jgi:methionyl-tRNA formyltransferase
MDNKIKIIFLGSPEFAIPSLQNLIKDPRFKILAVITQPDKPVGRKMTLTPPPVKKFALENNIPVWQPEKVKEVAEKISDLNPDFLVVVAYGKLVPKSVLTLPKYGCVNVHGSILPLYRGSAVLQAPILNGDNESGVTIMLMDEGLDTGPILKIAKVNLEKNETGAILHDKLSILGAKTLPDILINFSQGKIIPEPQARETLYCPEIKKADGKIDWNKPAIEIERQARAYYPWPGTFSISNYQSSIINKTLKIISVENKIFPINKYKPGEVFLDNNKLAVQCGQDALIITKLQLEGGKPLSAEEFLRGHKDFIGTIL